MTAPLCWRRCWWAAHLVLAVAAVGVLLIGASDLLRASSIAARITGGVPAFVAVLTLFAIGSAWRARWRTQWRPGAVAATVPLLLGLWVAGSIVAWRDTQVTAALIVSVLVAVVAGGTLLLSSVVRTRADKRPLPATVDPNAPDPAKTPDSEKVRRGEMLAAGATLAAALVALPLAWYSAHYLPTHTAPSITIGLSFGEVTRHKDQAAVPLTIAAENTGKVDVRIIVRDDRLAIRQPGPRDPDPMGERRNCQGASTVVREWPIEER